MKKIIAIVVIIGLASILPVQNSYAGDEGWAAAGGLVGGLILGSALSSRPTYYYDSYPSYYSYSSYPVYTYPAYSTYGYRPYRSYYPRSCERRYYYDGCY